MQHELQKNQIQHLLRYCPISTDLSQISQMPHFAKIAKDMKMVVYVTKVTQFERLKVWEYSQVTGKKQKSMLEYSY